MDTMPSLANHLLIAMPGMDDPNFAGSVALICHHGTDGAMGLVLNRPSDFMFGEILAQMGIPGQADAIAARAVLNGGPVAPERGFVLHSPDGGSWDSTMAVSEQLYLTTSRDILQALAWGNGPRLALLALGYAGWSQRQLETELGQNAWLSVPASSDLIFDVPIAQRWQAATRLIGIDPSALAAYGGRA